MGRVLCDDRLWDAKCSTLVFSGRNPGITFVPSQNTESEIYWEQMLEHSAMATRPLSRVAVQDPEVLLRVGERLGETCACGRVLEELPDPSSVMSVCPTADFATAAAFLREIALIAAPRARLVRMFVVGAAALLSSVIGAGCRVARGRN
jgi:hypothetical protein